MTFHPVLNFNLDPEPLTSRQVASACRLSGARAASDTWGEKTAQILEALKAGPLSRQQLAAQTGIGITSICSCVDALVKSGEIVSNGDWVTVQGIPGRRPTRQERFKLSSESL